MTIPANVPRGSYGPMGPTPPVAPFAGVAAAPPVIPKLYWDAYSDEQRIKALWACFNGLADRVNQLGYYYLPDFQGEWDRNKEYPPLSVVEAPEGIEGVTAGDSYTALDWVPVGTPLTDDRYWALTGNYNAQITDLENKINGFDDKINDVSDNLASNYTYTIDTTDDISNVTLTSGIIKTRGYFTIGDGGEATYEISEGADANDLTTFACATSGYVARIVTDKSPFNVAKAGIFPNGDDVSTRFAQLLKTDISSFRFNIGTYVFNNAIYVPHSTTIYGSGSFYNDDITPVDMVREATVFDFSNASFVNAGCLNLEYWCVVSNLNVICGAYTSQVDRDELSTTTPYAFWTENTIRENVSGIVCSQFSCKIDKFHAHGASNAGVLISSNACNVRNVTASNCFYGINVDPGGNDAIISNIHSNACRIGLQLSANLSQIDTFRCDSIRNNGLFITGSGNIINNALIDWCGDNAVVIQNSSYNEVSFTSSRYALNYGGALNATYKPGGAAIVLTGNNASYNTVNSNTWQGNASDDNTSQIYSPKAVVEFANDIADWTFNKIISSQLVQDYNTSGLTAENISQLLGCRGQAAANLRVDFATNFMIYYGTSSTTFNNPEQWHTFPAHI